MLETATDCEARSFALCPKFEAAFDILGKKWNGLIVDVLLQEGAQRFKDLAAKIPRCSDRVLVERLKELEKSGIVERIAVDSETRLSYVLTQKGTDLEPIMSAVHQWGESWAQ